MGKNYKLPVLKHIPELDPDFRPASMEYIAFLKAVSEDGGGTEVAIALERGNSEVAVFKTTVFKEGSVYFDNNYLFIERLVKSLLWVKGGWKVTIGGPASLGEYIRKAYSTGGLREFDAKFMSKVYEKPFTVEICDFDSIPEANEESNPIGRHLDGCRIGLDLGGSDRKVSAVVDGDAVYSEEVVWFPKTKDDPEYHYGEILSALKTAASKMPHVDSIGVSSAGIYINNRVMAASLFIKVPEQLFESKVKDIFLNLQKDMGNVPVEVANDGDVTALAGAMELNDVNVLGIAMGTSEAGGYVDSKGNITGWLNELAFVPVDFNTQSMLDEWSGDFGCGVKYFSQDAVIKLAPKAGITLDEKLSPAEKLKVVQKLMEDGSDKAPMIFESIGSYLGYAIAYYSMFYDISHILVLGRVTSGKGGSLIISRAEQVLQDEFPELAGKINIHLPDEASRRVGQSIAAASLPKNC